jgi:hypothetical protein
MARAWVRALGWPLLTTCPSAGQAESMMATRPLVVIMARAGRDL